MNSIKLLLFFLLSISAGRTVAQPGFTTRKFNLPAEIREAENQFSGLAIFKKQLFLMTECRLQEKAEAKIYAVNISDLKRQMKDSSHQLPLKKLHIYNLDVLRDKINAAGQLYEGLEAIVIDKSDIYFSVETATRSTNCYLLKGRLNDTAVILDKNFLLAMPKLVAADGSNIYNAGFEAVAREGKNLYAFFEYNFFTGSNQVYRFSKKAVQQQAPPALVDIKKLPFRITDIARTGSKDFTGINFFYKGGGKDTVYRTPADDVTNQQLIVKNGVYESYCRLINIRLTANGFTWQPLWEFPGDYNDYNWEGIAAYKKGFFLINDKYTPARPYFTQLLYLEPAK